MACACRGVWKFGSSIDNLTRKEIWEENFKTRENLKGVQQSEHFWDFQMTRGTCTCSNSERPLQRHRSLQCIDKIGQNIRTPSSVGVTRVQNPRTLCEGRCRRDVATETTPPRFDKSVGPCTRRVQLPPSRDSQRPFLAGATCPRYRPPDWPRNESQASKQLRQDSLLKLRQTEEALQQVMQRTKRISGGNRYVTEYTRSYKDAAWPKALGNVPRRACTPVVQHSDGFPFARSGSGTPQPRRRDSLTRSCARSDS